MLAFLKIHLGAQGVRRKEIGAEVQRDVKIAYGFINLCCL